MFPRSGDVGAARYLHEMEHPRPARARGYTDILMAKVLLSLDDALLRRIDRVAKERGLSRSAYLARLAERDLGTSKGPGAGPAARSALKRLDRLFAREPRGEDSTAAVRGERDAR